MDGPARRIVAMGAIGLVIGWLVATEPSLTHDSVAAPVLAAIILGGGVLAALVGQLRVVRRGAARYAQMWGAGTRVRFIAEAAFAASAALAWSIVLAVAFRS
jgi:hypothetical protein